MKTNGFGLTRPACLLMGLLLLSGGSRADERPTFHRNPFTLNGQPLFNYDAFSLNSRGVLALVEGNPASAQCKPVRFRAYLRRAGVVVQRGPSEPILAGYSVQLHEVLRYALPGDELVIDPVDPAHEQAKRVILLKAFAWLLPKPNADGC